LSQNSKDVNVIIYTGPSMNPTLQNLDKLFYAPYEGKSIKRGDIVVFFDPKRSRKVIHRVKRSDRQGILTKGDNNSQADASILHSDQIMGRIIYGERGNKKIRIYSGCLGVVQAAKVGWIREAKKNLYIILKLPYYFISEKLKLPAKKKVLIFQRPEGKEIQIMIGSMVVARKLAGEGWQIRPPFRLFLDESSLPTEADAFVGQ
jgi:signal peptidase I